MILPSGQGFHKKKNISQSHKYKIIILILIIIITGWCGLKSVEIEYKQNPSESSCQAVQQQRPYTAAGSEFEEHTTIKGHQSLVKEAKCYANEMGISLDHSHPQPMCKG